MDSNHRWSAYEADALDRFVLLTTQLLCLLSHLGMKYLG
jgi:hypothetical protein